jgi:dienelactone hydrolase
MLLLVSVAAARDLVPLDRYDPQPVQVGFRVSFSGERLAWTLDDHHQVQVAPISDLARVTLVAKEEDPQRFVVPYWAGEQLLIRHGAEKGEERLERFDLATGARGVLAAGADVLVFRTDAQRAGIGVYREPKARGAVEVSASLEPGVAEEITVYDDPKRRELEVRIVEVATGASETTWRGRPFPGVMLDPDLVPRVGAIYHERHERFDGDWVRVPTVQRLYRLEPEGRSRRLYGLWDYGPTSRVLGLLDGGVALLERREGVSALIALDLATRRERVILESPGPDLGAVFTQPDGTVLATALADERWRWWFASPELEGAARALSAPTGGDVLWLERRGARTFGWVAGPLEPGGLWMVEPDGTSRRLGPSYGPWDEVAWRPTEAVTLRARDGLPLTAYVTRPDEALAGPGPWPMVLAVHGGPWGSRDEYRWNPEHQRLADLGYAVMSVNFRGSDGFGEAFVDASRGQWGLAMQTDLLDGVAWAVERGVADPSRLAITGSSYGGYATLQALATSPGTFACGVAGAAPGVLYGPDRPGVLDEDPSDMHIGDRAVRVAASPLTHVAGLRAPLLVWHGERDQQVPMRSIEGFVDAAHAGGAPVTYVVFPQVRHGFERAEDEDALSVITARFLAGCLGGRAEGWEALPVGAELRVEVGAERLPGLEEALASR